MLWRARRALTPGEVRERLPEPLSYSTVVTVLSRLYDKHLLRRERSGTRAFAYQPVSDEAGLAALRMHEVLSAESDRTAVLSRFVSDLSDADEQLLRSLLDDADGTDGG